MIRGIFVFLVLAVFFGTLFYFWGELNNQGKWKLIKILGYATILSLVTLVAVSFIIVLF